MPKLALHPEFVSSSSDKSNRIFNTATSQFNIHDSQLMINVHSASACAPTEGHDRFTKYVWFTQIHITDGSWNCDLPSTWPDGVIYFTDAVRCSNSSYEMLLLWLLISFIYWWTQYKIVEQWLQIMWQLWMGCIITPPPNSLKCLAIMIRN